MGSTTSFREASREFTEAFAKVDDPSRSRLCSLLPRPARIASYAPPRIEPYVFGWEVGRASPQETYADGIVEPFRKGSKPHRIQGLHNYSEGEGEDGEWAKIGISLPTSNQHSRVVGLLYACEMQERVAGRLVEDGREADPASNKSPFFRGYNPLHSGHGAPRNDRKLQARDSGDAKGYWFPRRRGYCSRSYWCDHQI